MPASPNQLDELYRQIRVHFASHPFIVVTPSKGTSPEQYEIIYTITGMHKTGGGNIVEATGHKVELAIPFGFPHFPPSCKPKSDNFHPDFDPAAICLGDFWEQGRSLVELIIHIGQMINGEFYSTTNAFNEDAAEWYVNNSGKFPLARINWPLDEGACPSLPSHIHEIDTLDDADLTTEPNFLSLEEQDEDILPTTFFPEVASATGDDTQFFRQLEKDKKYYTLLRTGKSHPSSSEELTLLCQKAKARIEQAEKLHREAKKFETKGSARVALDKYQQLAEIITDFPLLDADMQRVNQLLPPLEDISPDLPSAFSAADAAAGPAGHDESPSEPVRKNILQTAHRERPITTPQPPTPLLPSQKRSSLKISLFLGLLAVIMAFGGYLWQSLPNRLSEAEDAYAQCSTSFANNEFEVAKRSCEKALQLVGEVKFIQQDFARQLEKFILEILQSERLIQGLAGNILFDGRYIPEAEAEVRLSINRQLKEADALFMEEKWQPALQQYQSLLAQVENKGYPEDPLIDDIRRKQLIAGFRIAYDPAKILMRNSQWEEAIEKLLQAQKILVSLPASDRGQYSEHLQEALQKSQFANLKEQGDLSFTSADWLNAIASYNLALASSQKTALPPESIDTIRNNIRRAELYNTINKGNKAFASGAWDEAIAAYSNAGSFLAGIQSVSGETYPDMNIRKLDRIILQASIIRDRQAIQTLLDNNELAKAKQTYQQILNDIAASSFQAEQEFAETTTEINTALQSLEEKIYLTDKLEYLKNNFQSLFVANYPSAEPENLSNPIVSKTKETDSQLIFRMQCTETGGGRPLALVMFYSYDKKTGRWSFFSEM